MAPASSASRSDRRLLPIVLITMMLLVAAFIILTEAAHAATETVGRTRRSMFEISDSGQTSAKTPRNACDQAATLVCQFAPISIGTLRR